MQEEEYTFVTLDGNDVMPADDLYSTDMDGADISFIV